MKGIIKQYIKEIQKVIKNIFFIYNGNMLNEELKIEEINNGNNEIKILAYELDGFDNNEEELKESEFIIYPNCKELCFFNINNYKINLSNCKNNHYFSNFIINEFNDIQKINESKKICHYFFFY